MHLVVGLLYWRIIFHRYEGISFGSRLQKKCSSLMPKLLQKKNPFYEVGLRFYYQFYYPSAQSLLGLHISDTTGRTVYVLSQLKSSGL